ncbi:MAG: SufD family Fe-S cluster assembly protein [Sulfolobales archaeon]
MAQESSTMEFQRHGDSPTVKSYTDWSLYRSVYEKLLRKELSTVEDFGLEASGNVLLKEAGRIRLYESNSLLPRLHSSLSSGAKTIVFQGGEAIVKLNGGEGEGVAVGNLILDVAADGTVIVESRSRTKGELSLLGLNIIVRSGVKASVMIDFEEGLESPSSLNFMLETGEGSQANLALLVYPGRMSRIEGVLRPGGASLVNARLSGILREGSRLDAIIDGLISWKNSSLSFASTLYLKDTSMGSVRGKGVVYPSGDNARIVYGLEAILEENATGFMQPFLEVHSNRVLEARHYAKSYLVTHDKLFYLTSRGLSLEEARRLVLTGLLTSSMPLGLKNYSYEKISKWL